MKLEACCQQWHLTRHEVKWTLAWASLVMALTFVPYLIANALTPPGMRYTWLLYNPDEPNVHLQWMREAYEGKFFFGDRFTTERVPDQFSNVFLWALGRKAALKHALWGGYTLIVEYHVARFCAGVFLLGAIYWLAAQLTDNVRVRQTTFWLCASSSGLGWLNYLFNFGFQPADVNVNLVMPEAITFLSILLYPLFAFSMFLMVMTFTFALANNPSPDPSPNREGGQGWGSPWMYLGAALCAALLANVHTYDVIPLWLTLGVWSVRTRRWPFVFKLFIAMLPSVAVVAYQFFVFRNNAVFRAKALTITATPAWPDLLMTYGLVALLALAGAWQLLRTRDTRASLTLIWAIVGLIVIYIPTSLVSFQRKMIEGWHIPLCFLAAVAVVEVGNHWKAERVVVRALTLVTVLSNVAFLHLALGYVAENNISRALVTMPPYFLRDEEVRALDWLEKTKDDGAVLCLPYLGAYIPGRTGKRVYLGHWAETINFKEEKLPALQRFFGSQMNDEEAHAFLGEHNIRFVVYGFYEKATFPDWRPPSWLSQRFDEKTIQVYEVRRTGD